MHVSLHAVLGSFSKALPAPPHSRNFSLHFSGLWIYWKIPKERWVLVSDLHTSLCAWNYVFLVTLINSLNWGLHLWGFCGRLLICDPSLTPEEPKSPQRVAQMSGLKFTLYLTDGTAWICCQKRSISDELYNGVFQELKPRVLLVPVPLTPLGRGHLSLLFKVTSAKRKCSVFTQAVHVLMHVWIRTALVRGSGYLLQVWLMGSMFHICNMVWCLGIDCCW